MHNSIINVIFVVVAAAIAFLFAAEIGKKGKSAWKKTWVRIVVPLFFASTLSIVYDKELIVLFEAIIDFMNSGIASIATLIKSWPFDVVIAHIIITLIYTFLPCYSFLFIFKLLNKKAFKHPDELVYYTWALIVSLSVLDPLHLKI